MDKGIIVLKKHNYPSQLKWNNHANIQTFTLNTCFHLLSNFKRTEFFSYEKKKPLPTQKLVEDDNSCFHPNQSSCSHQPINQTCQIKGSYKQHCGASLNITLNQSFTTHQWTTLQRLCIQVDTIMIHSSNLRGKGVVFCLFIIYCQCVPIKFPRCTH